MSRHVSSLAINTVVTFDRHGISSHKNHISIYYAMACLALEVRSEVFLTVEKWSSTKTCFVCSCGRRDTNLKII